MSTEFKFLLIDANMPIEVQQNVARDLIVNRIDLNAFRRVQSGKSAGKSSLA